MLRILYKFISIVILINISFIVSATEKIPNDVLYMLEDLYGADKNKWPSPRYSTDLNKDGFLDWVAIKNNCKKNKNCPAEIFICVPDKKGSCSEYCYIEVKTLKNIEEDLKTLKCESTC